MTIDEVWFLATMLAALCVMIGAAFIIGHQIGYARGRLDKVGPLINALFERHDSQEDDHGAAGRPGQGH